MNRMLLLLLGASLLIAAAAPPSFGARVPDPALARMRGGFRLPNGIDVSLAVATTTTVNGAILLRSIFRLDDGASLGIYVPRQGTSATGTSARSPSGLAPAISYNPQSGLSVMPGTSGVNVSVSRDGAAAADPTAGLEALSLAPGESAATPGGTVSHLTRGSLDLVRLEGDQLATTHFFGGALGALTVNTGSDRAIDSTTSISIGLGNATPDLVGSALLRLDDLALDARGGR